MKCFSFEMVVIGICIVVDSIKFVQLRVNVLGILSVCVLDIRRRRFRFKISVFVSGRVGFVLRLYFLFVSLYSRVFRFQGRRVVRVGRGLKLRVQVEGGFRVSFFYGYQWVLVVYRCYFRFLQEGAVAFQRGFQGGYILIIGLSVR